MTDQSTAITNLFELLGRPVEAVVSDSGTSLTFISAETYDDDSLLPTIEDCGTMVTRAAETYDDDSLLPTIEDCGTMFMGSDWETHDNDSVQLLM
ncbi:MAG: hypothetical protein OXI96_09770 [Acidimicrobiaceae bacterium]|nr:hypothetical protein [Acidimicrobiaceae bacterium]